MAKRNPCIHAAIDFLGTFGIIPESIEIRKSVKIRFVYRGRSCLVSMSKTPSDANAAKLVVADIKRIMKGVY